MLKILIETFLSGLNRVENSSEPWQEILKVMLENELADNPTEQSGFANVLFNIVA